MKNCRLKEIEINESNPYSEDLLKRKLLGDKLLLLVDSFSNGFVMAINGKWGSGKLLSCPKFSYKNRFTEKLTEA